MLTRVIAQHLLTVAAAVVFVCGAIAVIRIVAVGA